MPIDVRATIPEESSGRLLNAITDIIRPWSEKRGLKADQIRLQREDVLLEIAKKTKERIDAIEGPVHQIPNKGLIKFLEVASLEEIDDSYMVNLWAGMLYSAVRGKNFNFPRYVSILGELTSAEANLLEGIITHKEDVSEHTSGRLGDAQIEVQRDFFIQFVKEIPNYFSAEQTHNHIESFLTKKCIAIDSIAVWDSATGEIAETGKKDYGIITSSDEIHLDILASLGLVEWKEFFSAKSGKYEIDTRFIVCTRIGVDLFACCNPTKLRREW